MTNYDFIIKLETRSADVAYLNMKLNITNEDHKNVFLPRRGRITDDNKTQKFFEQVPKHLANALYEHYKADFLLFGYDKPIWLC